MKPRLAILYAVRSTFVKRDVEDLTAAFDIQELQWPPAPRGLFIHYKLRRMAKWADIGLCWFAAPYAAATIRAFHRVGKPVAVIIGGYDVAKEPWGHGALHNLREARAARFCIAHADCILPVASHLNERSVALGAPQDKVQTVFNAVEAPPFFGYGLREGVLMVATAEHKTRFATKGIDRFVAAATATPDVSFTIIGIPDHARKLLGTIPSNLNVEPPLPFTDVWNRLCHAKVYAALSRSEGLPTIVLEAQVAGCRVVATDIPGHREAVADDTTLVDEAGIVPALRNALVDDSSSVGGVLDKFRRSTRLEALTSALSKLMA